MQQIMSRICVESSVYLCKINSELKSLTDYAEYENYTEQITNHNETCNTASSCLYLAGFPVTKQ